MTRRALPFLLAPALLAAAPAAAAPELLEEVAGPVYEAQGDAKSIARRGSVCIGRLVKPGFTTAPTIVAQDLDGGVVVANSAFEYVDRFIIPTVTRARAKLTFEARDGRFRITHSEIQQFVARSWRPVGTGKDGEGARAALLELSDRVAACVKDDQAEPW